MKSDFLKRIGRLEKDAEMKREAWRDPDPLSAALREVNREQLMELAAELDSMGGAAYG